MAAVFEDPTSPRKAELARARAALIDDVCARLTSGHPPWWGPCALAGPVVFAPSGVLIRGVDAVLAWSTADILGGMHHAWEFAALSDPPCLVVSIPGKHGTSLHNLRPSARRVEVRSTSSAWATRDDAEEAIRAHLHDIRVEYPHLVAEGDSGPITDLAATFLRALGSQGRATRLVWPAEDWTPKRLNRVAALATALAGGLTVERTLAGEFRRAESAKTAWPRASLASHACATAEAQVEVDAGIEAIRRNGTALWALPGEWWDTPRRRMDGGLEPSFNLRAAPLRAGRHGHASMLSRLSGHIARVPWFYRSDPGSALLAACDYDKRAVLGLALCAILAPDLTVGDAGEAWRTLGRYLRGMLASTGFAARKSGQAAVDLGTLIPSSAFAIWNVLKARHRSHAWMHGLNRLRLGHLLSGEQFSALDPDPFVEEGLASRDKSWMHLSAASLPIVHLMAARQAARHAPASEAELLAQLREHLGAPTADWPGLVDVARQLGFARRAIAKRGGGVRWIETANGGLKGALRTLGRLLVARFPANRTATAFLPGASIAIHARAHAGPQAAARLDIADFFGSIEPRHLRPWFAEGGLAASSGLFPDFSPDAREAILAILFCVGPGARSHLPQGAPSSPAAANLAGLILDHVLVARLVSRFGPGRFTYTRYADDLLITTRDVSLARAGFCEQARDIAAEAVSTQGWRVNEGKTHLWRASSGTPLTISGLVVPDRPHGPIRLDRDRSRRARAALHQLRMRAPADESPDNAFKRWNAAHGLLAYAYAMTGDARFLAFTSRWLARFAEALAGPLFGETLLAGWADEGVDDTEDAP